MHASLHAPAASAAAAPGPFPWVDVLILLALIGLNAIFAMSELAIVSARPARLKVMAGDGSRGAAVALDLARDPGKLLSTAQVGITLIGIVAGAYSGASLGGPTAQRLHALGVSEETATTLGFVLVIGLTTYVSLVIGELIPKQVALMAAEKIATRSSVPMLWLSRVAAPLVWVLDRTSGLFFTIFGLNRQESKALTAEELHLVVTEATHAGVIEEHERQVIAGVVRLADRPVREVMTPRTDVDWLPRGAEESAIRQRLAESPHTRIPVAEGSVDDIVGVVQARDLLTALVSGAPLDLDRLMRKAEIVPDQMDAMDALVILRGADVPMLLVHDEYGHFEGLVTPSDLLSAIAGEFASDQDEGSQPHVVEREDGSLLIAGAMPADQFAARLGLKLPEDRDYATAAGHVLAVLRHLPKEGECFSEQGWRMEVLDLDGRKIDKLLARREVG